MTPAARDPILSTAFHMPSRVEVVDGQLLAWESASDRDEITFPGGSDLLAEFLKLTTAEPAEMATFMEIYGVPEICVHGLPDRHVDHRRKPGSHCSPDHVADGRPAIRSSDLRSAALAFQAAKNVAQALSARSLPSDADWAEMGRLVSTPIGRIAKDWREDRAEMARWFTFLMSDSGAKVVADWDGPRLIVTHEADGLLGTLVILLARDLGQGAAYLCSVCNEPVSRIRPPKKGHRIYCDKPACRREQQRRNQANWRKSKREREESTNG